MLLDAIFSRESSSLFLLKGDVVEGENKKTIFSFFSAHYDHT